MPGRRLAVFAALVVLAALGLTGAHAGGAHAGGALELAGSEWRPVELGGETVPTRPGAPEPFIRFEAGGKMAGNAGCNRFFGSYATIEDTLEFGPIGATRMACPKPVMEWEDRFMQAIQAAGRYERQGRELVLTDGRGNVVARLRQRDAD